MKTGIEIIADERNRQIEVEGYDGEHDKKYVNGQLAMAAGSYAVAEDARSWGITMPRFWPWQVEYWKPTPDDRIKELAKAGALIAAEIDRIQRT